MNLTFGNSKLLAFSPLTPTLSPLRGEGAVQGPNVRPKFRRSKLPMNLPLRSSRRQEAHSTPTRSSEKRSEPFDRLRVYLVTSAAT